MSGLLPRNLALKYNTDYKNGADADIHITVHGSDWYYAVCALMTFSSFVFIGLALLKDRRDRAFHYITAGVVIVAAIAYWSLGSNLGFTPIEVQYHRHDHRVRGKYREVFWVRYVDWFVTTPLLLMDLLLTAGMPWPTILWAILMDEIMIITGLVGALTRSSYKWGYFAFGNAALAYIVYLLVWEARRASARLGSDVKTVFFLCGTLTSLLWICYPICWGVSEGGNIISPDSEAVFYGVLDVFAKPFFGALLIWGHRNIDPARLGLEIKGYDEDKSISTLREKSAPAAAAQPEATNGHHTNGQQTANEGVTGTSPV